MEKPEFWELYSGKRRILGEALIDHDPYDQFAWCQNWRFAIADYLVWDLGEYVPDYNSYGPDSENWAYEQLMELSPDVESLEYALMILHRFRVWLGIAGKDY